MPRAATLRARIMLTIALGAILPLALFGAWLTASGARSGRNLLQAELDSSVARVSTGIRSRWEHRSAELELLATNDPARRLLERRALLAIDATYFLQLRDAFASTIRDFSYKDTRGAVQWTTIGDARGSSPTFAAGRSLAGLNASDVILVRRGVRTARGDSLGIVEAHVRLAAILPNDSVSLIVAGASLGIQNRETGERVGGVSVPATANGFVSARRALADPPLDIELAVSDARYVQPFARTARLGIVFLLTVTFLVLVLTTLVTRRLTGSLEQMAGAADAVAAGDLDRRVSSDGGDELSRLAGAFNSMTESLRRTLNELSKREALAAVGQFAASLSHEVRNALTSVRLDLQRLAERTGSEGDKALAQRMLRNVQRLDQIVTGSLRVARSDPATMRPVVLEGVVRAAMTASESAFSDSGSHVALSQAATDRLRVRGDAGALEQLFVNLLLNAAQASGARGVTTVALSSSDAHAIVRIADTGSGIPEAVRTRLGQPFVSSRADGTGLGFAIATQIASAHGGEVSIVNTHPGGTTIDVVLPRHRIGE